MGGGGRHFAWNTQQIPIYASWRICKQPVVDLSVSFQPGGESAVHLGPSPTSYPALPFLAIWIPQKGKGPRHPPRSLDTMPFLTQFPPLPSWSPGFSRHSDGRESIECHWDDANTTREEDRFAQVKLQLSFILPSHLESLSFRQQGSPQCDRYLVVLGPEGSRTRHEHIYRR